MSATVEVPVASSPSSGPRLRGGDELLHDWHDARGRGSADLSLIWSPRPHRLRLNLPRRGCSIASEVRDVDLESVVTRWLIGGASGAIQPGRGLGVRKLREQFR